MPPEYAIDGIFSVKSDVFSYGVLLLEIITGKRNRGFHHPHHHLNLLGHVHFLHFFSFKNTVFTTSFFISIPNFVIRFDRFGEHSKRVSTWN